MSVEQAPESGQVGPLWLTKAQLAERWGVGVGTVNRLIRRHELHELEVGYRTKRISMAEVVAWEAAHLA